MSFLPEASTTIRSLLGRKEGQLFDRKSIRIEAREFARHLIAFANADGGEIAIGITNDNQIEGASGREEHVNELLQASINFCEPPVRTISRRVSCINRSGSDDYVVLVGVEASERVHTRSDGDTFLRISDESRRLTYEQHRQLLYDKGEQRYEDELVAPVADEVFDADLLARFQRQIDQVGEVERVLSYRFLSRTDASGMPYVTRAGILLFHATPTRYFPQNAIRFLRYQGVAAATGVRINVVTDRRYEGPLPRIVDEIFTDLSSILREFTRLNPETSRFESHSEYPTFAWQEAIVNAVIHRAYSIGGQSIEVRLFDDRLEVESPGRLPGMVRVENMRDVHFLRNPRIARVMNDFGFAREIGEGVNRMYEEMALAGLPEPTFQERAGSLIVTLQNDRENRSTSRTIADLYSGLAEEQRTLLSAILLRGGLAPKDAEAVIGRSRPTTLRHMNVLIEAGLVKRQARTTRDPSAVYIIASQELNAYLRDIVP
jgi:ATP-dependent DNA helicase RecG